MTKNRKKTNLKIILALVICFLSTLFIPIKTLAISSLEAGVLAARTDSQPENIFGLDGVFTTISNTLLYIIGVLSVLMIIVGGIKYVLSGGKESSVTKARNTILYAIIGLVITLLAYGIINFVIESLIPGLGGVSI